MLSTPRLLSLGAGSCRAACLGHFLVIQTLSAHGADFTLSSSHQENAIFFATQNNHLLCIRLLGQRGEIIIIIIIIII